jgi:predicted secreted protein
MEIGKTVLLQAEVDGSYVTIGATRNHDMSITNDVLETTTKDTERWKTYVQLFSDLEFSLEGLHDPTGAFTRDEFLDVIENATKFKIRYGQITVAGAKLMECDCILQNYSEGSPHDGLWTWNATIKPNDEPTFTTGSGS